MIQEKRNMLVENVVLQLITSTVIYPYNSDFGTRYYEITYPFSKYCRDGISDKKGLIREYIKDNYNIDNKEFTNKVYEEYIKVINRKRREILGL